MDKKTTGLSLLILKMTLRDWRAGELRLLLAALLVSVAALSAVGFLVERTRSAMEGDSRRMLGGDLVLSTDTAPDPAILRAAQAPGLRSAAIISLLSMATPASEGTPRLVSLKGVGAGYPLFGGLSLRGAAREPGAEALRPGTAWIDGALAASTGLKEGDPLQVGGRRFTVAGIIEVEPDRRPSMLNLAPRVMIGKAELESMDLVGDGTRAVWRLQVSGSAAAVDALRKEALKIQGGKAGLGMETLESSRTEMAELMDRAQGFLSLVSLLAAALAAIALALAARRFVLRHIDACAMLRCLGLRKRQVTLLFLGELALLGIVAGVLGAAVGYGAHLFLLQMLGDQMAQALAGTSASWRPALHGIGVALVLLAGFALPQLLQMLGMSHVALTRREGRKPGAPVLLSALLGLSMALLLLLWQSGDVAIALGVLLGLPLLAGAFALLGWCSLVLLERSPLRRTNLSWQFALASLCRRKGAAIVQMVALALGLTALLLLTVVKIDLLAEWRAATPAGAPNHFVGNIQPEQLDEVNGALARMGKATPYSSIRARLVAVNGKPPRDEKQGTQAQSLQSREWEISTATTLPAWYTLTAGAWPGAGAPAQLSVDEGLAQGEGFKLGDVLTFDVAGDEVKVPVTSLRKTNWRSRQGSYVMLLNEDAVTHLPRTYTTTLHVLPGGEPAMAALAASHPNLIVFNVGYYVAQVERLVGQLTAAVEFLFMFVLAAGVLVLYTALLATQDERTNQAALLRALGATRATLSAAQWLEHLLSGMAAGMLAGAGATLGHWALAKFIFKLEWHMSPLLWGSGLAAGIVCAAAGGWLALRPVLNQPPLQSLRQA